MRGTACAASRRFMHRVSIELVPRSLESLAGHLRVLAECFPSVRTVNIPDLLRFDVRSWDACHVARRSVQRAIPHLRAMDFSVKGVERLAGVLRERGLSEVLIVRGDAPQDLGRRMYSTTSAELIRALNEMAPEVRAYAAFDPYRAGLRAEIDSVHEKLAAGAVGLFSQPLFDLRFMDLCADQFPGVEVYWGVSPVVQDASRRYWEVKNRAFFPSSFQPTLEWNREFAVSCLEWARERQQALYFMPIRVDLERYLGGLL